MINALEIKKGHILEIGNAPWKVVESSIHTPSARGASSIAKVKFKNLITGQVLSKSYRGGESAIQADCEKRNVQYLYSDGNDLYFMDEENYDQFSLTKEILSEQAGYLAENLVVRSLLYNGNVVNIELPNTVELKVVETDPVIKGATAQAQLKPAILETGIKVMVPPYLSIGEMIKVDTRNGSFVERIK